MSAASLDSVIHAPIRLQICAFLAPIEEAEFQVLRDHIGVSDSVLSKHITHLESASYVVRRKGRLNGRRCTWLSLSTEGREAFSAHVEQLRSLLGLAT